MSFFFLSFCLSVFFMAWWLGPKRSVSQSDHSKRFHVEATRLLKMQLQVFSFRMPLLPHPVDFTVPDQIRCGRCLLTSRKTRRWCHGLCLGCWLLVLLTHVLELKSGAVTPSRLTSWSHSDLALSFVDWGHWSGWHPRYGYVLSNSMLLFLRYLFSPALLR